MISGKREKGVVLRDPNFKSRPYDMVASACLMLEEFIARFDRMLRSGQNLDHMKFIAVVIPCGVKPRLVIKINRINNHRISVPTPA